MLWLFSSQLVFQLSSFLLFFVGLELRQSKIAARSQAFQACQRPYYWHIAALRNRFPPG